MILLFEDIRQAETHEHALRFIKGPGRSPLVGVELYLIQSDRNVWEVLKNGNFAAANRQFAGQLAVELYDRRSYQSLLLGVQDGDGYKNKE